MEADVRSHTALTSPLPIPPRNNVEKQFIVTFKSLPVLWDKNNPHYTNKHRRNEALMKLLSILKNKQPDATVLHVKSKINSLRTNYRRDLRKIISSQKSGEVYVPKTWTFKYLCFLSKNDDILLELSQAQESLADEIDTKKKITVESSTYLQGRESSPEFEMSDPLSSPSIKQCEDKSSSHQMYSFSSIPTQTVNATAMYWTEKLSRLSHTQRIYAEKAINEILFEAELGTLNKNSVKINEDT